MNKEEDQHYKAKGWLEVLRVRQEQDEGKEDEKEKQGRRSSDQFNVRGGGDEKRGNVGNEVQVVVIF